MNTPQGNHPEAGLLRMLRAALRAGLAPDADDEAFAMTRSAAQIVGLAGLDACLAALESRRGHEWHGPAQGVVETLEKLATENSLAAFRAADDALLARAELLRGPESPVSGGTLGESDLEAEAPDPAPPLGTMSVEEALGDLPLSGDAATGLARRARLSAPVAAALRASLEWLTSDPERPRPFRLRAEDSVLEVQCEGVHPDGLLAAHEVLAECEGSLAPTGEVSARASTGAWTLRVPAWSPRPVHLMLEQGALRLAVPWHSVLRLSLVPSIEIEMRGGSLATPVLAPLAPLAEGVGERPVVAIAHGLKRALLVADRLVWRLGAESCDPDEPPPVPLLRRAVCSDEAEIFWVVEPSVLLESLPLPALPASGGKPDPQHPPRVPPAGPIEPDQQLPLTVPTAPLAPVFEMPLAALPAEFVATANEAIDAMTAGATGPEPMTPVDPHLPPRAPFPVEPGVIELSSEDVEPLELSAADVEPIEFEPTEIAAPVVEAPPEIAPAELTREDLVAAPAPAASEPVAPAAEAQPAAEPLPAAAEIAPADLVAADVIATPEHYLPDWIERFGAAGAGTRHAEPLETIQRATSVSLAGPAAPAVLIAEDSFAARHFLARHFEQRGFAVEHVETAAALRAALAARAWRLVCVDVELPDSRGDVLLQSVRLALGSRDIPLVALVRDDEDTEIASAAGVRRWLRKPFDGDEIDHLLSRLGLVAERNA